MFDIAVVARIYRFEWLDLSESDSDVRIKYFAHVFRCVVYTTVNDSNNLCKVNAVVVCRFHRVGKGKCFVRFYGEAG